MTEERRILTISRRSEMMSLRTVALSKAGYEVTGVLGLKRAMELIARHPYDVVIIGSAVANKERKMLLASVRRLSPSARILVVSRPGFPELAADANLETSAAPDALVQVVAGLLNR